MRCERSTNLWDINLEDSLILCPFSKIIVVSSPLGPVSSPCHSFLGEKFSCFFFYFLLQCIIHCRSVTFKWMPLHPCVYGQHKLELVGYKKNLKEYMEIRRSWRSLGWTWKGQREKQKSDYDQNIWSACMKIFKDFIKNYN